MNEQRGRSTNAHTASVVRQRAHHPDYRIAAYVGVLMLLGLIVMYAIGPQRAQMLNVAAGTEGYSSMFFVVRQVISLAVALAGFVIMSLVPLATLRDNAGKLLIAAFAVGGLLFLLGNVLHAEQVTQCSLGACRWFKLGPLGTFQPAELLKFAALIFVARFLAERVRQGNVSDWQASLQPLMILVAAAMVMVIIAQKDMGTGITLIAIVAAMLLVANIELKKAALLFAGLLAAGVLLIVTAPHRIERVVTFLTADDSSAVLNRSENYHTFHAKIAIGSGGLFGVGIGNSVQATGYLPEAINDSVFAIIGEITGFVGVLFVIGLFTGLLLRILRVAEQLQDPMQQLLAAGVFGWVASHVVLNIASMIGVFPLTGITLPLLSFGGTSMFFIASAIGIVFAASRHTSHQLTPQEVRYADNGRRRGIGRTRYAGRRSTR
ncbi:hypothetical protein CR983_00200 [Candidatus Saccharibacteria bacterium]|nr:MAG: hypothetical protein CR983_00200 [Candidatus Saccharibacteria bacterium]